MTREELIAAVIAAPDDDGPRLVLADWFAEQGDPRGELIHVGCALEDGSIDESQREACERRYVELVAGPGTLWLNELGLKHEVAAFHRGMVEAVSLPWSRFTPVADRLFASTPLRGLTLWDFGKEVRRWPLMPWLGRLESLHLRNLDAGQLGPLLAPAGLTRLRRLMVESPREFGPAGAQQLVATPLLPRLAELGLINAGMTDAAVKALAEHLGTLTALDLTLGDCGLASILALLPRARALRRLALGSNPVGDRGALELAEAEELGALESLRLEAANIGDKGAWALIASQTLASLRSLDLASNAITDRGAVSIAAEPDRGLRALKVTGNTIGAQGDKALRARYGARVWV